MHQNRPAVILVSGGLDSATALAEAKQAGFELNALTINYGQRHAVEIEAARRVALALGTARHVELEIDLRGFGGARFFPIGKFPRTEPARTSPTESRSLTSPPETPSSSRWPSPGPKRSEHSTCLSEPIALTTQATQIAAQGISGRSRCSPIWRTRAGVEGAGKFQVHSPLLMLTKEQIIARGLELGVDYGLTHSCYDPAPRGFCSSSTVRRNVSA